MKLDQRALGQFIKAPNPGLRAILVYGPDTGLVRERSQMLLKAVVPQPDDPFRVAELTPAHLRETPSALADEAAALSFGGGRRAVRLRGAGNGEAEAVAAALRNRGCAASLIIVEAGELGPRDALRKLFEQAPDAGALACYADSSENLRALAVRTLKDHGLAIEPDALRLLVDGLGSDRLVSRAEIDKLALYKGRNGGTVSVDDVRASLVDAAATAGDDIALAAASGDLAALDRALARAFQSGEDPGRLLGLVLRHLQRLHQASAAVAGGQEPEQALKSLRPPVFWKLQDTMRGQLRMWSRERLGQALNLLLEAQLACRTTGTPARAIAARACLQIANAARQQMR